jgi:Phage integrase, N-terminal SAM-like domain
MSQKPVSDLRRRMLEDMSVRRLGEKTQNDYIKHVEIFTRFLGRSPDTATAEDLRAFQVHELQGRQAAEDEHAGLRAALLPEDHAVRVAR